MRKSWLEIPDRTVEAPRPDVIRIGPVRILIGSGACRPADCDRLILILGIDEDRDDDDDDEWQLPTAAATRHK